MPYSCSKRNQDKDNGLYTFGQDVEVNSVCSSTGKPLKLKVSDGKVVYTDNPDLRIIHINLEKHSEWASSC